MNIHKTILTIFAAISLACSASAALINDTTDFSNWYKGDADTGTLTKGTDLVWTETASNGQEVIGRSFTETALSDGQTMTFSFDWTQSVASVSIIRVGLYNTTNAVAADGWAGTGTGTGGTLDDYEGYYSFLRDGSGSANAARLDVDIDQTGWNDAPMVSGTSIGTSANNVDLVNDGTKTYNVSFSITQVSGTQVDTLFSIFDGASSVLSIAGSQTSGTTYGTFDAAFIRSSGGTMTLDNITVAIPEPSSLVFLGLAGLAGIMLLRPRG